MNALTKPEAAALAPATPAQLLQMAVAQNADIDKLERLMVLQREWLAAQAKAAFDRAFAAFKAEAVRIVKNTVVTDGPLKGKTYVNLQGVVDAVTPALSAHGLSTSWKLSKDEPNWMEVTCTLRHVDGHQESVSMSGEPDTGPGRNKLQARASTKNYLERYTLLAITGMAAGEADDDGAGGAAAASEWAKRATDAATEEELARIKSDGEQHFTKARNVAGYREFMAAVTARLRELRAATRTGGKKEGA